MISGFAEDLAEHNVVQRIQADANHLGISLDTMLLLTITHHLTRIDKPGTKTKEPWEDGSG